MNATLYLTPDERPLFEALSADLKEGWKVVEETQGFEDTEKRMRLRFQIMHVASPALLALQKFVADHPEVPREEVAQRAKGIDITQVGTSDLRQIFYAIGPGGMSALIVSALREAKTDEDISFLSALTELRHDLLAALISAFNS